MDNKIRFSFIDGNERTSLFFSFLFFLWTIRLNNNEQLAKRLEKLSHSYFLLTVQCSTMFLLIHCFLGMHAVHHRQSRFHSNAHACTFLHIWLRWKCWAILHPSYVADFTTRSYRRFVILWSLNVPNGLLLSVCFHFFFSILDSFKLRTLFLAFLSCILFKFQYFCCSAFFSFCFVSFFVLCLFGNVNPCIWTIMTLQL